MSMFTASTAAMADLLYGAENDSPPTGWLRDVRQCLAFFASHYGLELAHLAERPGRGPCADALELLAAALRAHRGGEQAALECQLRLRLVKFRVGLLQVRLALLGRRLRLVKRAFKLFHPRLYKLQALTQDLCTAVFVDEFLKQFNWSHGWPCGLKEPGPVEGHLQAGHDQAPPGVDEAAESRVFSPRYGVALDERWELGTVRVWKGAELVGEHQVAPKAAARPTPMHPPSIPRATWRCVLPPDTDGDVGLGFDWADGSGTVRVRLSAEHARQLLGALESYLRDERQPVQSPNSSGN